MKSTCILLTALGSASHTSTAFGFQLKCRFTIVASTFLYLNSSTESLCSKSYINAQTSIQEVIDKSKSYSNWNFYYTNVTRQVGNVTMASYESSLGRETSTNYPLVNFLMATEADFFIGALGSTWCFLIDGMRNTGGKVMAGYLSVNKDRFW